MFNLSRKLCLTMISFSLFSCANQNDIVTKYEEADLKSFVNLPSVYSIDNYIATKEYYVMKQAVMTNVFKKDYLIRERALIVVIRKFLLNNEWHYAFVNVERLNIGFAPINVIKNNAIKSNVNNFLNTPYLQSLKKHVDVPINSLNSSFGVKNPMSFSVTVDMCPSSRAWDYDFFKRYTTLSSENANGVPIGIAITGYWVKSHIDSFKQLINWHKSNKLDITWINHSWTHALNKVGENEYLGLTAPSVDFESEVLSVEQMLLEQGEEFSLLFRFPGLWHNAKRLKELNDLSLFAIDTDTWLAKGKTLKSQSIILVHGNGNERPSIEMFFKLLPNLSKNLSNGSAKIVSPLGGITYYNQSKLPKLNNSSEIDNSSEVDNTETFYKEVENMGATSIVLSNGARVKTIKCRYTDAPEVISCNIITPYNTKYYDSLCLYEKTTRTYNCEVPATLPKKN